MPILQPIKKSAKQWQKARSNGLDYYNAMPATGFDNVEEMVQFFEDKPEFPEWSYYNLDQNKISSDLSPQEIQAKLSLSFINQFRQHFGENSDEFQSYFFDDGSTDRTRIVFVSEKKYGDGGARVIFSFEVVKLSVNKISINSQGVMHGFNDKILRKRIKRITFLKCLTWLTFLLPFLLTVALYITGKLMTDTTMTVIEMASFLKSVSILIIPTGLFFFFILRSMMDLSFYTEPRVETAGFERHHFQGYVLDFQDWLELTLDEMKQFLWVAQKSLSLSDSLIDNAVPIKYASGSPPVQIDDADRSS